MKDVASQSQPAHYEVEDWEDFLHTAGVEVHKDSPVEREDSCPASTTGVPVEKVVLSDDDIHTTLCSHIMTA